MSLIRAAGALRCLRPMAVNTMATRKGSDHHHEVDYVALAKEVRGTLNDLPIPQGDWQEDYNKRNSKYNLHLGISAGFFLFTIILSYQVGAFDTHSCFNVKKYDINP